jgi:hypothetical protein
MNSEAPRRPPTPKTLISPLGEYALQSVADAMRDAASTATEHTSNVYAAVGPRRRSARL